MSLGHRNPPLVSSATSVSPNVPIKIASNERKASIATWSRLSKEALDEVWRDRVCARKFQTKLDVIASVLERLEHRFDVIVDELTKYSPNARKLTAKAG
jgi:hypothetical protein